MICALVKNNTVEKVVTVNTDDEYRDAMVGYEMGVDITSLDPQPTAGWTFDGNKLIDPLGLARPSKVMSRLKFAQRFTSAELAGIEVFAWQSTPQAAALRVELRKQMLAQFIDLSLPETATGLFSLVALGLLTADRANTILTTPVTDAEKYKG